MTRLEKYEIKLTDKASESPVKYVKRKADGPYEDKFVFVPRYFAQLSDRVNTLHWDQAEKTLHLEIRETHDFEVHRWLQSLIKNHQESQKSPFADSEVSTVALTFLDESDGPLAVVHFRNVTVVSNDCSLSRINSPMAMYGVDAVVEHSPLLLNVTLSYVYGDLNVVDRAEEGEDNLPDSEWQVIETP